MFYREKFSVTHARISLDELKTRARERALLEELLAAGRSFVVDNTNVLASERAVYIEAAKRAGFRVVGYFLDLPVRDAMRRNAQREGRAKIPAAGVAGTAKKLERPDMGGGFEVWKVIIRW